MIYMILALMFILAVAVFMLAHDFYNPPAINVQIAKSEQYDVKQLAQDLGIHLSHSINDCPDVKYSDGPEGWNAYCACEIPKLEKKPKKRKKK